MNPRLSLLQHFLGTTLFLLTMAYGVVALNAFISVTGPRANRAALSAAYRQHDLALIQVRAAADPAAACRLVGAYFDHAAIVETDRTIRTVCSGEAAHLRVAAEALSLDALLTEPENRLAARPYGGGHLFRAAPLLSGDPGGDGWFLVSVSLPKGSWFHLIEVSARSFLPFLLFAFLLIWWKTRQVGDDLRQLNDVVESFRMGRLDARPPVSPIREIAVLQRELGLFAEETETALALLHKERNELDAVFSAMTEGVVVLDIAGRVSRMNRRALEMFSINPASSTGRPLIEVIRHAELEALVSGEQPDEAPVMRDFSFEAPQQRIVQVHCSRVRNAVGLPTGTLLVLEEVTLLRRLESVRREFSSNVSHELKTPITSILGFVETLRDETSTATEEERRHYLDVMARSASRLHAIVEDLLNLSRIELITDAAAAGLEPVELSGVLEAAVGMCAKAAQEREVRLEVEVSGGPVAELNASLFEQALVNVIDNAIKYGPEHSIVQIQVEETSAELRIHVRDRGLGIPEKDLPHIFERFYRVDKGRSRKAGGTGLGLSIARHIMQVHRGGILVKSVPGEGTCFTLVLPQPAAKEQKAIIKA